MFCTKCGNQIKDGSRFCGKCGALVTPVVVTPVVETPVEDTPVADIPVAPVEVFEDIPDVAVATEPAKEDAVFEDVSKLPEEAPVIAEEKPVIETPVEIPVIEEVPETAAVEQAVEEMPTTTVLEAPVIEVKAAVDHVETVAPQPVLQKAPAPLSQYQTENASASSNLKKSLGSVVAVIAAIVYLIILGVKALGTVEIAKNLNVGDVAGAFSADMANYETWLNVGLYVILFIGFIPMLLIAFGLIFNVIQSYRKRSFCPAGFTTIRIAEIIKIVFNAIVLAGAVYGALFALLYFDGFIDSLAKQFSEVNVTANFDPLTNTVKWIMLVACGFIALWKAMEIIQNAVVLFGARRMKDAISSGCSKERRFVGLRALNYILVFLNGIILSVQIVCLIMSEKIIEIVGETTTDLGTFTSKDIGVFEELVEYLCKNSLWGLIASALLICVYLMYNANISNFVQKDEQIEIQK